MPNRNDELTVKNDLRELGYYFTDLRQALEILKTLLNDPNTIEKEITTIKDNNFTRGLMQSVGSKYETLKTLKESLLDFGLNILDLNTIIKELKDAIENVENI